MSPYVMTYVGVSLILILITLILIIVVIHSRRMFNHQMELRRKDEEYAKQLLLNTLASQENERQRLAEDLHDEMGALLSNVRLSLNSFDAGSGEKEQEMREIKSNLDLIIDRMRTFSRVLHPRIVNESGLYVAITSISRLYNANSGTEIVVSGDEIDSVLKQPVNTVIYRILLELLNNLIKHDSAKQIDINFSIENPSILIQITHDGTGFDQKQFDEISKSEDSFGLKNINHRLNLLSGTIHYSLRTDIKDAEIKITLPIIQSKLT